METIQCNTLVIGGGPGGYVAAIRAGKLGLDTVLIEADTLGGTCLNVGCIPSKALIHAAEEFEKTSEYASVSEIGISCQAPKIDLRVTHKWKDSIVDQLTGGVGGLLKRSKVKVVKGWASFIDGKTIQVTSANADITHIVEAQSVVIATGSTSIELPFLPFGGNVISSTEALALNAVPKTLTIIGAGYIGLELGIAYAKLGASVTIVEQADRILPLYDAELTAPVLKRLKALGVTLHLSSSAKAMSKNNKALIISAKNNNIEIPTDKVLVTVGRKPNTQGWGLENLVIDMQGGFLKTNARCETSMSDIYAIGDITSGPMLAHKAMAQGEMVAEIIAGHNREWDKVAIPAVCFTDPEIVTVGLSLEEAQKIDPKVVSTLFPFAANGRAMTMEAKDGFIRIYSRSDNHLILGIQAVGKNVSELSTAFSLAIEMRARLEDISETIHAHPTLGEAFQETALRALGKAVHI